LTNLEIHRSENCWSAIDEIYVSQNIVFLRQKIFEQNIIGDFYSDNFTQICYNYAPNNHKFYAKNAYILLNLLLVSH